mgnify:CR=1 FL=1|jgi:Adenylate cyclase, family 3 (some proteins contain HAMP domain)
MRVRTQLVVALGLLAGMTAALVAAVFFFGARDLLFRQIRSTVLSVAATGAVNGIDIDAHERIRTPEDESGEDYAAIRERLRDIREANRRKDIDVRFIYTMRPTEDGGWEYVVDAEEEGADHSRPGDPVVFEGGEAFDLNHSKADDRFSHDEFGTWLSAEAPLRKPDGEPVALLAVDVAAHDVVNELNALLWRGLAAGAIALAAALFLAWWIARWFTRPLEQISAALGRIGKGDLETRVEINRTDEFGGLASAVNEMAVTLRERDALKRALARYVSREVAEEVLAGGEPMLRGARKEVTILIVDIRNFTAMSGRLTAEEIVTFLNAFFARMIDAIFANRGTLDKFLGDGCLAIFGAPVEEPEHHRMAVRAAKAMLAATRELGVEFQARHGIELRIGIALHAGQAIVGNVGSEDRIEYTAIGDTVNVASRVEALNKEHGTELLVTEDVVRGAGDEFAFREVGEVALRGVSTPVKIFTL